MATPFDSFNRSPLDAFVQSALLARGAIVSGISRTVALSFALTPTPTVVKYPRYALFAPSTQFVRLYQDVGGSIILYSEYSLGGGGDLVVDVGPSGTDFWRIDRQRTGTALVPADVPAGGFWRVRVQAVMTPDPAPADVYIAPQVSGCDFNGPAAGWFLGMAFPGMDNRFDPGPLIPGQRYYLFFRVRDDLSYVYPGNDQYYSFRVSNDGVSIRLETYI